MADIDIEKKNAAWPWILAAVVVAIILLVIFIDGDTPEDELAENEPVETTIAADAGEVDAEAVNLIGEEEDLAPVIDFVTFVTENEGRMGLEHNYTHDALVKLVDAIQALAEEINYEVEVNLSEARELANEITTEPYSEQHGNRLIEALRILTNALTGLQEAYYPTLSEDVSNMEEDITQLEEIVNNLNPQQLTLEQKQVINSYFNQAAQVLKLMN